MTRFSIGEEDEEAPPTLKRVRFSELLFQSVHTSQSPEEDDDEDEDSVPIEHVESDSQGSEEDDEEVEVCEDVRSLFVELEPLRELQNHQQLMTSSSSTAASLLHGLSNVVAANRSSPTASTVCNNNANGELKVVLTDPDVLDCPICLDPLCTPVFQCENGHIACSSCCLKVERTCPSCCMPIGYNRCRAIEKVIESVKVSCKNALYGCTKVTLYSKKSEHEQMCPHVTCFCPHPSCPFAGSSKNLYLHFSIQHAASITHFTYDMSFFVNVTEDQNHVFLQEQHESVIFILNHQVKGRERAFSVDCIGPHMLKTLFDYRLTAKNTEATLILQCVPEIYTKWSEHTLSENYLTVPSDFLDSSGILSLQVCIKKAISLV